MTAGRGDRLKQTMVGVFERVYETGPVFRAEPHDAEYVSLDAELGFISDHRDVLAVLRHALAGMPPHGGFAIGLERWTGRLTGAGNIREVTLFPRDLHRMAP